MKLGRCVSPEVVYSPLGSFPLSLQNSKSVAMSVVVQTQQP